MYKPNNIEVLLMIMRVSVLVNIHDNESREVAVKRERRPEEKKKERK